MSTTETIPADCLAARHVGRRIRVAVIGGPVIEDTLKSLMADNPGEARVFVTFQHVRPSDSSAGELFAVKPDTDVAILGSAK